jgi:hypothetical protein
MILITKLLMCFAFLVIVIPIAAVIATPQAARFIIRLLFLKIRK